MSKLEFKTDAFESKLIDDTAVIHLTGQALDILTEPANSDFYDLLGSIKSSPELRGYVQINDRGSDIAGAVNALAQFISQDDEVFLRQGRYYGFQHEAIAARFRSAIGRVLLAFLEFEKPMIAGLQGLISGEYLGLTLAFDWRIATADTTISFENVRTGLPSSPGVTFLMPRYVGIGRAMSLIHRGATIDAHEALDLGLISDIVDSPQELEDRCVQDIRDVTEQKRYLVGLHRQHVFPSPEEMRTALERYYDGMVRAIAELRAETR